MLTRALIVLLLVLNVGVALWWATRPADAPETGAAEAVIGVARLQLVDELPGSRPTPLAPRPADAGAGLAMPAAGDRANASAAPARCLGFGPFTDAPAIARARAVLAPVAARVVARQAPLRSGTARGWRVVMPPLADRAAAQAMAARLQAAGFRDYFVMSQGGDANGIALGRYGAETSARRHAATLREAGFAGIEVQALGVAEMQTWLDVALRDAASEDEGLRRATGAARVVPRACAELP